MRVLEAGERLPAGGERPVRQRRVLRVARNDEGDRNLVQHPMLAGDNGHLQHALDPGDDPLDLRGRDVLAPDLEHVLGAVGEIEEAVLADPNPVAGDEQAVLGEGAGGRVRIAGVLQEQRHPSSTADQQIAGFARTNGAAVIAQDVDFVGRYLDPDTDRMWQVPVPELDHLRSGESWRAREVPLAPHAPVPLPSVGGAQTPLPQWR